MREHPHVRFTAQNILLTIVGAANLPSAMCMRGALPGEFIAMTPDMRVDFDTYFNSFSLKKWLEWTSLVHVALALELRGDVTVELIGLDWHDGSVKKTRLLEKVIHAPNRTEILADYPHNAHSLVTFSLTSHKNAVLYSGRYVADVPADAVRQVKLALVLCTYKREEYVKRNVELLLKIKDLQIFVVDNGQTLGGVLTPRENLHICPNRNAGGSGGFARGIMEAALMSAASRSRGFTHVLLMDDDVSVNAESIDRLIHFLRVFKGDEKTVVGGAMLAKDKPSIQEENGAWVVPDRKEGVRQISNGRFVDLCSLDAVVRNETPEDCNPNGQRYQPWYFCCFPISAATVDNLPLPLFLRGDDIEYSLRNFTKFVNMNGLCVWHDSFEKKPDNMLHYYVNRNLYIIMAFSMALSRKYVVRRMLVNLRNQLYRYNYNAADAVLDAFSDFMTGPRYLANTPPESILERQKSKNESMNPSDVPPQEEMCERNERQVPGVWARFIYKIIFRLTVGGHWIPSVFFKPEGVLSISGTYDSRCSFLKKRLRVIDTDGKKELLREINRVRCVKITVRYIMLRVYSMFRYRKLRAEWNEMGPALTRQAFWKQHLGI